MPRLSVGIVFVARLFAGISVFETTVRALAFAVPRDDAVVDGTVDGVLGLLDPDGGHRDRAFERTPLVLAHAGLALPRPGEGEQMAPGLPDARHSRDELFDECFDKTLVVGRDIIKKKDNKQYVQNQK